MSWSLTWSRRRISSLHHCAPGLGFQVEGVCQEGHPERLPSGNAQGPSTNLLGSPSQKSHRGREHGPQFTDEKQARTSQRVRGWNSLSQEPVPEVRPQGVEDSRGRSLMSCPRLLAALGPGHSWQVLPQGPHLPGEGVRVIKLGRDMSPSPQGPPDPTGKKDGRYHEDHLKLITHAFTPSPKRSRHPVVHAC